MRRFAALAMVLSMGGAFPALAAEVAAAPAGDTDAGSIASASLPTSDIRANDGIPAQLDADQRTQYHQVFENIRAGNWLDARLQLASMKPGPLHSIALAELYTAKGSPKADVADLAKLITDAPELPEIGRAHV